MKKEPKSTTVSVRLTEKVHYATSLAASKERQTLAGFIETATIHYLKTIGITQRPDYSWINALEITEDIWDEIPEIRLHNLATQYYELLTFTEKQHYPQTTDKDPT